jgi:hypothetical protein
MEHSPRHSMGSFLRLRLASVPRREEAARHFLIPLFQPYASIRPRVMPCQSVCLKEKEGECLELRVFQPLPIDEFWLYRFFFVVLAVPDSRTALRSENRNPFRRQQQSFVEAYTANDSDHLGRQSRRGRPETNHSPTFPVSMNSRGKTPVALGKCIRSTLAILD